VCSPDLRIDPRRDAVTVDGVPVGDEVERLVLALHKPVGHVTTRVDPRGRPTVYDLVGGVRRWVFPVGRLDLDSSGLLILTNDHRLGHSLSDPDHRVPKTYHARVRGVPPPEALQALREGLTLDGGTLTRPAGVQLLGVSREANAWLAVTLTEGKNRQVRRMCAAVGHDVVELVRVAIGRFELGDLAAGEWRRLTPEEVAALQASLSQRPHPCPSPKGRGGIQ
jgi:pseudouridine synthase